MLIPDNFIRYFFAFLLSITCLLSAVVEAAVSLDRTIKADGKSVRFENIAAMIPGKKDAFIVVDASSNELMVFDGGQQTLHALSGQGRPFGSSGARGLTQKDEDSFFVSSSSDDSVAVIARDGKLISKLVAGGSQEGLVSGPAGISWSNNRRLYVADKSNGRISVFGDDGVFIQSIGKHGLPEGSRLEQPVQVYVDPEEKVYVLETRDEGVVSIFSHDGSLLKRLSAADIKKITGNEPEIAALAIDNTGLIYLGDNANGRVYQIDWQKEKVTLSLGSRGNQRGQFDEITSLVVLNGNKLAVADRGNKKIEIYTMPESGRALLEQYRLPTVGFERTIGLKCSDAYRLQGGNALCIDNGNDKVSIFNSSGRFVKEFKGKFSDPVAASVDDQDVVILDDESIKIYRLDGEMRFSAGASGSAEGQLDSPKGIHLGKDKIYVADTGNRRIQIFSKDGIYLEKISNPDKGAPIFIEPVKVVVDTNNNLYVLDRESKQVLVFSPNNKLLYRIGGTAGAQDSFEELYDITVDADNNLYILSATRNNRASVQVYSGPTKSISMGAYTEQRSGMQGPRTLSIAPARKTLVSVYDKDKNVLLNYKYMQLPARVGGLEVKGSTHQTTLSWQGVPGSYISRYKVFGSPDKNGIYKYLTDVDKTEAKVKHSGEDAPRYYRVSAVSGFSVEGEQSNTREDMFQAGYALYRDMDYARAEEIFNTSYKEDPANGEVLKYLGLSAMKLNKVEDSVSYFRELSLLKGYEIEGLNLQVGALVANNDYVGAKAVIDKVIDDNTATIDTIVYCGELSLRLGDAIGAVGCLEKALAKDKNNIKAHFLIGRAYIKLGIVDKGMAEFKTAESIDPQNAEVWYQSGLVYQQLDKQKQAIKSLEKALSLKADYGEARLALARSYLSLKQYDEANNIAIKLAGSKETATEGHYLIGIIAFENKKYGEAVLALNKATRADASNADAWLALADTYTRMNQNDKVRDTLASAVEGNKNSYQAAYRLGVMDYEEGRYKEAATSLEIASQLQPDNYDAYYKLADSQYHIGAYNRAAANAAKATGLKPENADVLALSGRIANRQGKTGKAIDFVKKAMTKEKNSARLHTQLGELYAENSLFDQAKTTLEKAALLDKTSAAPYVALGALYSQRRLFDESIAALDKAVKLDPSEENKLALDTAYAEKKKSQEFKSNTPQLVLKDLRLDQVFSAAYKQYAQKPVGHVRLENISAQDYGNLKVTFSIKGYMDFPATTEIPMLKAKAAEEIQLKAAFNNKILEIDEDTGVQVEIAVNFIRDGRNDSISVTQPMTIYGKNAIVWGQSNMVGAFVTPKDDTLRDFVRKAINENKPDAEAIQKTLLTAMTVFDVFTAHGIKYVIDPNAPYSNVSETSVDYVQFARETLKLKSGDCDDLSVLLSASLENLGIETAILDVPAHLLMMFNTGLSVSERRQISLDDDLLVIYKDNIWIPVEATMIGTTFAEAWAEGARKYHEHSAKKELKVIAMSDAWQEFKPVTLKPADYSLNIPEKSHVSPIVTREKNLLLEKSLDRLVGPYRAMVSSDPGNMKARMQIAIIYAKYGLEESANREFDAILEVDPDNSAVYNNRGNIYFHKADYERAIESYSYAEKLASNDPGIKMNLSMAHYKLGNLRLASARYNEAAMIDEDVNKQYAGYSKLLSN